MPKTKTQKKKLKWEYSNGWHYSKETKYLSHGFYMVQEVETGMGFKLSSTDGLRTGDIPRLTTCKKIANLHYNA